MHKHLSNTQIDQMHIWHPYHSILNPDPVIEVEKTKGCLLYLKDGRVLIDGMASWWCVIHGYNHPVLLDVMRRQIEQMPHVMFGGITHEPAINLVRNLLKILPKPLDKIFFCDSGSVSVEVAMKMAIQYWQGHGQSQKVRFASLKGGYHGDTMMAMSVCDPITGMHHLFNQTIPKQVFLPKPPKDVASLAAYKKHVSEMIEHHANKIAALIVEPLLQGAGGMHIYPAACLQFFRQLCDQHNILLIFDEIATGFGRLGDWFATTISGVVPDILCIGKALTGGYLSLAATVVTKRIVCGIEANKQVLMHGPTFMANPLACALASASVDLLLNNQWQLQVRAIENIFNTLLLPAKEYPCVKDIRVIGAVGIVELNCTVVLKDLQPFFVQQGVWIRPFNRLIYMMPPFVIDQSQLECLIQVLISALIWLSKRFK